MGQWPVLLTSNAGDARLNWTVTTSQPLLVSLAPSSAALDPGAVQPVTLSGVLAVGGQLTVSFTSDGGDASVVITCS